MAGLVSYALLQQEDPIAMAEALNFHLAFGILKSVLTGAPLPTTPRAWTGCEQPRPSSIAAHCALRGLELQAYLNGFADGG